MATKPPSLSSDSSPSPDTRPAASKPLSKSDKKAAKAAKKALKQQEAFRRAASEPLRNPITGEIVDLSEHEFSEWPVARSTPTLPDDDDWIGDAHSPTPAQTPSPPPPSHVHPITGDSADRELRDNEFEHPKRSPGLLTRLKAAVSRAFSPKEESDWTGPSTPPPLPTKSGSPSQLLRTESAQRPTGKRAKTPPPPPPSPTALLSVVHPITGEAGQELRKEEYEHRQPSLGTRAKNAVLQFFSPAEEDLWIGLPEERPAPSSIAARPSSAPQLDAGKKEEPVPLPSFQRRPPVHSPESPELLQSTHVGDRLDARADFEMAELSARPDPQKTKVQRPPPEETPVSQEFLQARHQEESEDELRADQELAAIFHPPQQEVEEPLVRPDAPLPGTTLELHDRRPGGGFHSIATLEIDDSQVGSPDSARDVFPLIKTEAQAPLKPTPQRFVLDQVDPSLGQELGTLRPRPEDAGHLHTTAAPVVIEEFSPANVEATRETADSATPKPLPVTAGLSVTATPSTNPPAPQPGRQKFYNLPIKWEKKTYYLTIDNVPPNLTREQVIAIVTARLIKLGAAGDPAFHPGMVLLDLTFDGTEIRAEAAGNKRIFDAKTEPEVAYYTAAMQTGKMDNLETLPEYTETIERCRTESVRIREPGKSTLHSERVTESRPVHPTGPVRYIGFVNLGNTCYVNAALQAIATNTRLRTYLLQQGALPDKHPLKAILTEYEARLQPSHRQYGRPIDPSALIAYLRQQGRISGPGVQGDAHEAFLALLLDANPNLPNSPIKAQETQTSVRTVPHLNSPDIHRARLGRSQFPLIQLTAPQTAYHLQAHLADHFSDSPRLREPSAPDKIHRGFEATPELLAVAVGRRNGNGTKNMIPIQQPDQLSLEAGWAHNSDAVPFETDCFIYHTGTSGKTGHYVTIVKEHNPDHPDQFRYVELSDDESPRVITDFQSKAQTASMIFYHRADAPEAPRPQAGLKPAWRDSRPSVVIEDVTD